MPTSFLNADTSFPRLTEEMPVREQLMRVENYLFVLLEQLRYALSNLGAENFNDAALKEIGEAINEPVLSVITDMQGNISSLEQTASSLTTRVANAEGDISSLEQTASSLTTRVSNAEGDISQVSQTADKINWIVASGTSASNMEMTADAVRVMANGINLSGSTVMIDADKIRMTGTTEFLTPDDVGDGGSTVIAGNRISLNIEGDDDDGHTSLYSDNGVNFRYETTGDSAKFAEINTSINGSDSDVSSRYALNIRATGFINAAGTPVHPSVKIYSSGKSSLEAERELYIASLQRAVTIDGNDFTAIRANVPYADISGSPSARDYVFCTDGIYYGGVKIVST